MAENAILQQITAFLEGSKSPLPTFSDDEIAALYALAFEMYRNGKYSEAMPFFRFLTILSPDDRKYWMGLGACYQMQKRYQAAIECYSVAAVQNPNDPIVHWHAANCFFDDGKLDIAIKTLDSALTVAKISSKDESFVPQLELVRSRWIEREGSLCQEA